MRFSETDERRNGMVMKAQLCFVFLFAHNGKPLTALIDPLTKVVESLIGRNQNSAVEVFIDNLEYIIKSSESLPLDLHTLFGVCYIFHQIFFTFWGIFLS